VCRRCSSSSYSHSRCCGATFFHRAASSSSASCRNPFQRTSPFLTTTSSTSGPRPEQQQLALSVAVVVVAMSLLLLRCPQYQGRKPRMDILCRNLFHPRRRGRPSVACPWQSPQSCASIRPIVCFHTASHRLRSSSRFRAATAQRAMIRGVRDDTRYDVVPFDNVHGPGTALRTRRAAAV